MRFLRLDELLDEIVREEVRIEEDEPVYTSGVVSRILDIPVWILKQLDREQIVSPPREEGRSRLYSYRDLKKLVHVWHLMRERDVNIGGVKVILELEVKYVRIKRLQIRSTVAGKERTGSSGGRTGPNRDARS